ATSTLKRCMSSRCSVCSSSMSAGLYAIATSGDATAFCAARSAVRNQFARKVNMERPRIDHFRCRIATRALRIRRTGQPVNTGLDAQADIARCRCGATRATPRVCERLVREKRLRIGTQIRVEFRVRNVDIELAAGEARDRVDAEVNGRAVGAPEPVRIVADDG